MYRDGLKGGPVLLSNSQAGPGWKFSQCRVCLLAHHCKQKENNARRQARWVRNLNLSSYVHVTHYRWPKVGSKTACRVRSNMSHNSEMRGSVSLNLICSPNLTTSPRHFHLNNGTSRAASVGSAGQRKFFSRQKWKRNDFGLQANYFVRYTLCRKFLGFLGTSI